MKNDELREQLLALADALGRLPPDGTDWSAGIFMPEPDGYVIRLEFRRSGDEAVLLSTRARKIGVTQSTDPAAPFYEAAPMSKPSDLIPAQWYFVEVVLDRTGRVLSSRLNGGTLDPSEIVVHWFGDFTIRGARLAAGMRVMSPDYMCYQPNTGSGNLYIGRAARVVSVMENSA